LPLLETSSKAFPTPELLIQASDLGHQVRSVPVTCYKHERGVAMFGRLSIVFTSVRDLFVFWLRGRRWHSQGRSSWRLQQIQG
jgi:hypothetical protein